MPIPDFQSVMLPVLKVLEDRNEHMIRDSVGNLAETFALAPEELAETLDKSGQSRFASRVQ